MILFQPSQNQRPTLCQVSRTQKVHISTLPEPPAWPGNSIIDANTLITGALGDFEQNFLNNPQVKGKTQALEAALSVQTNLKTAKTMLAEILRNFQLQTTDKGKELWQAAKEESKNAGNTKSKQLRKAWVGSRTWLID